MPSDPATPAGSSAPEPDPAAPVETVPTTRPAIPRQAAGPETREPRPEAPSPPAPSSSPPAAFGPPPAARSEVERAATLATIGERAETSSKRAGRRLSLFGKKRGGTAASPPAAVTVVPAPAGAPSDVVPAAQDPQGTSLAAPKEKGAAKLKEPFPSERPPGAPIDPWTAFAQTPEHPPGLMLRATRAFFRSLIHEYALAIYAGLLLAVGLTWPTLRYPLHTLPEDLGDPARQAWQISWIGHILLTNPQQLWQSNAYFPEPNSFAFGDSLLGYGPVGMLGDGPLAATLRYNILFVLAHALLAIGGYALVRQLGAGRTGAAVAAVAIAYAPWRLAQEGHLDIISAGGIPLALAMLARGHGWSLRRGLQPQERNAGWAAFGWLVAAWQISLGFSLGLPFLGVLGLIVLLLLFGTPLIWQRRRSRRRAHLRRLAQPPPALGPAAQPGLTPGWAAQPTLAPGATAQPRLVPSAPAPSGTVDSPLAAGTTAASRPAADTTAQVDASTAGGSSTDSGGASAAKPSDVLVTGIAAISAEEGKPVVPADEGGPAEGKHAAPKAADAVETPGKLTDTVVDGTPAKSETETKGPKHKAPKTPKPRRLRVAQERDFFPVLGWRLLIIDALGPVILAGIAALVALPYFHLADKSNSTAEIKFFSPPLWSLLIGPAESRVWGGPHASVRASLGWPAEMSLLPGFVLYALALAGLWFSVWKLSRRILLMIALAASIVLTMGTKFFGGHWTYLPLFGHLPASLGQRIPGRMMLWVTLLLGILAAGAVAEFVRRAEHWSAQRIPPWPAWWLRLATLVPLILVIAEGWNTTAHPVVPAQPASMRTITSPMLVLPTGAVTDGTVMLWSTTRYQKIANGSGGFAAGRQQQMRTAVASFPDATSIEYLRSIHVTTVLLVRSAVTGTPWERAGDTPVDSLGITREDVDGAVVFHLG
jgi:hypothetical protein